MEFKKCLFVSKSGNDFSCMIVPVYPLYGFGHYRELFRAFGHKLLKMVDLADFLKEVENGQE